MEKAGNWWGLLALDFRSEINLRTLEDVLDINISIINSKSSSNSSASSNTIVVVYNNNTNKL